MITQDAQQAIGFRKSLVSASGAQKLITEITERERKLALIFALKMEHFSLSGDR